VPPPDRESRLQILRNHLKRIPTEKAEGDREGLSIKQLVDKTEGFSGAEVVSICNEAAIFAIDENADVVTQAHLERAIAELKPQITEKMLDFYRDISLRFIS
jgi:AAA family ATPase